MNPLHRTLIALSLALCLGCGPKPNPAPPTTPAPPGTEAHEDHDHGSGPHGGVIGEFGGGKYHIEFTVDHAKQEASIYILGEDAKTLTPIKADKLQLSLNDPAVEIELAAKPEAGEATGSSSRFAGTHEALAKEQLFAGSVTALIEGTPHSGDFAEKEEKARK